jgi:hypothetical protein
LSGIDGTKASHSFHGFGVLPKTPDTGLKQAALVSTPPRAGGGRGGFLRASPLPPTGAEPMDHFICYPMSTSIGGRKVVFGYMEAVATIVPDDHDPSEWRVSSLEIIDTATDDGVPIDQGHMWWEPLIDFLFSHERHAIDDKWIAHRNAEGDTALYGQEV